MDDMLRRGFSKSAEQLEDVRCNHYYITGTQKFLIKLLKTLFTGFKLGVGDWLSDAWKSKTCRGNKTLQ